MGLPCLPTRILLAFDLLLIHRIASINLQIVDMKIKQTANASIKVNFRTINNLYQIYVKNLWKS
ncbi:hypothetical protein DP113_30065 [Brasilonema octagenarum UFV-E1]|uniref:Uncharacterized protein n=2 Tax=Brasilonema TaxID=383614 RepID=A0A856MLY3_9CYAN|nr:hypothetical protein [Brasilonema octagenarum UFV-OR1]QDL11552.1 hypothetical protein DP114_29910 [Brasilonema sennae CENA114]QDL17933.1 hypothetical protein DP113_30065 [Brasilonema octagenarum UFV-E1]